ncbi:MAG TPA: ABC transporter transmembrane domain-containing protein, partial [Rhizobiaceae bacterium]|nr:ABC transporter transmembrane domain-containing protein [Rhizobiaceae bacterium]
MSDRQPSRSPSQDDTTASATLERLENVIDPFHDTDREVLPQSAFAFIRYFAEQARGPFLLLLVAGAAMGAIDAALYWSVGWLIDVLDAADPATLFATHWRELAGFFLLLFVVRAVVMIANAIIEQQVVVPSFFSMVRWQAFRRVIEQPTAFYQNDFAGRIATKVMQAGEATGDFITGILQTLWSFLTFILLAIAILGAIDPWMGVIIAVWTAGYVVLVRTLLPRLRAAGRATADARSILNGRMVDAFTNIVAVKLFDAGRREHGHVREGLSLFLSAVRRLTRMITAVRSAVAILNGLMMSGVAFIAIPTPPGVPVAITSP